MGQPQGVRPLGAWVYEGREDAGRKGSKPAAPPLVRRNAARRWGMWVAECALVGKAHTGEEGGGAQDSRSTHQTKVINRAASRSDIERHSGENCSFRQAGGCA